MDAVIGGMLGAVIFFTFVALVLCALRWIEKHYS